MTRLELATSRPPDVCATNCATSRTFRVCAPDFSFAMQRYDFILYSPNIFCNFARKIKKKRLVNVKTIVSAPDILRAEIKLSASKSISNRALVIRALSGSAIPIDNVSDCDDSRVVQDALQHMPKVIDIKAAGTAMRFITSFLATVPGEHIIKGTERMHNRPIAVLVDALRSLGADICYEEKDGFPPLRIQGRELTGGQISLPGNVSSQYISSLLMIAPTLKQGFTLEMTGDIISRPYIDMTLAIMRQFGAQAQWNSEREIRVEAVPYSPTPYYIEGDWSAASYWYEMVALSGDSEAKVVLPGLFRDSLQGDSAVSELFSQLGVTTTFNKNSVCLTKRACGSEPFVCNMLNQPDLAQTLMVTCCMMGKHFRISGLQTLRIKETDRIAALQNELGKLGFHIGVDEDDTMFWNGEKETNTMGSDDIAIDTYEDHRMAMAFAPVALKRDSIIINNPDVVSKSYPSFWEDMRKAGFKLA